MIEYIESFLIICLEILSCKLFYGIFGEKRRKNGSWSEVFGVTLLSVISFFSSAVFADNLAIKTVVFILEVAVIMYVLMEMSFLKSLILDAY